MQKNIFLLFILFPLIVLSQNWETMGNGISGNEMRCFYEDEDNDELYIGGMFSSIDNFQNNCIATWNGTEWNFISDGVNSNFYKVNAIIKYLDTLYIGGEFTGIGNNDTIRNIAKWNGNNWEYITEFNLGYILDFKIYNNELYAFGGFDTFGNISSNGLIKYNGYEWNSVFNLPKIDTIYNASNQIYCISYFENELYVGGNFHSNNPENEINDIIKYNGTEWVSVGDGLKGASAWVNNMIIYKGDLIVAGYFSKFDGNAGDNIMKWDGEKWSELFPSDSIDFSSGQVMDLKIKNDELYISGSFGINGFGEKILKWDGHNLCAFGGDFNNNVYSMGFYRDTLYVGCGTMIDSLQVNRIAKWIGGNDFDTCSVLQSVPQINNELNNLIIYPNPTNGEFNIKLNSEIPLETEITIFSINGSKLFEKQFYQTNEIKINNLHLEKGVYFVKIKTDEFVITKKLIIN
jgi:hypothetical protein